jgi:hypothetical protein
MDYNVKIGDFPSNLDWSLEDGPFDLIRKMTFGNKNVLEEYLLGTGEISDYVVPIVLVLGIILSYGCTMLWFWVYHCCCCVCCEWCRCCDCCYDYKSRDEGKPESSPWCSLASIVVLVICIILIIIGLVYAYSLDTGFY